MSFIILQPGRVVFKIDFRMDYVYPDMSTFVASGSSATPNQAQEHYGENPHFQGHASGSLSPSGYFTPTDHYVSNFIDILPKPYTCPPSNASSSSHHQDALASSMVPPTKKRKKKAPTLSAIDWEPHKARIVELHITQNPPLSLKDVQDTLEREVGFRAEYVSPG